MPPADEIVKTLHDSQVGMPAPDQHQMFFHEYASGCEQRGITGTANP
jgi:hypothetical protein